MTYEERTIVRAAINQAKRAWLESRGGFDVVEQDARWMDQKLAGGGRGTYPRGHGTPACYRRGCRAPACVEAYRTYNREWAREHRPVCDKPPVGFLRSVA